MGSERPLFARHTVRSSCSKSARRTPVAVTGVAPWAFSGSAPLPRPHATERSKSARTGIKSSTPPVPSLKRVRSVTVDVPIYMLAGIVYLSPDLIETFSNAPQSRFANCIPPSYAVMREVILARYPRCRRFSHNVSGHVQREARRMTVKKGHPQWYATCPPLLTTRVQHLRQVRGCRHHLNQVVIVNFPRNREIM